MKTVMGVGDIGNGKSTLLNSIAGEELFVAAAGTGT
jgi:ethanolamine utilization protein EutP (predicted NTPase)